jgi:hypothetical protein
LRHGCPSHATNITGKSNGKVFSFSRNGTEIQQILVNRSKCTLFKIQVDEILISICVDYKIIAARVVLAAQASL